MASTNDGKSTTPRRFVRFNATICSLLTVGLFGLASNSMSKYDEATGGLMALTVCIFTYNWYMLHGSGLTRARRAFLSVANVLDTYQIYNRKYGQFYESDPDTPGDAAETFKKAAESSLGDIFRETTASTNENRAKFEEAVRKHYAGVYQAVQRAEREMGTKAPIADDIDTRQDGKQLQEVKLIPALSPHDLTAHDKAEKSDKSNSKEQ